MDMAVGRIGSSMSYMNYTSSINQLRLQQALNNYHSNRGAVTGILFIRHKHPLHQSQHPFAHNIHQLHRMTADNHRNPLMIHIINQIHHIPGRIRVQISRIRVTSVLLCPQLRGRFYTGNWYL